MIDDAPEDDPRDPRLDAIAAREVRLYKDNRNQLFLEAVISLMLESGDSAERVAGILRDQAKMVEEMG